MRTAKQLSVPLVNRPGRLATVLDSLAKEKAHALALCVMDTGTQATLRLIPDDLEVAIAALKSAGVKYQADDVLLLEANHRTGGMQKICRRLAEEHLNIEYVYAALGASGNKTSSLVVIRVNDLTKAQRVLSDPASTNGERPKKRPTRRPTFAR